MDHPVGVRTEQSEADEMSVSVMPQLERNCLACRRRICSTSYRCPYCGERKVTIGVASPSAT
jgi:hypothetical protein